MRMRVMRGRSPVCCPARMGNTSVALQIILGHLALELCNALGAARPAQFAVSVHGDAARIVAAILKPLQSLEQDWNDISLCNCADDSTHRFASVKINNGLLCASCEEIGFLI